MNTYFLYLRKVGFDLPAEIPPLGLSPPHSASVTGGSVTGPISTSMIWIAEDAADADNLRFMYSAYTFNRMLVWPDAFKTGKSRTEAEYDEKAGWILDCYFPASFVGHKLCGNGTPGYEWLEALWEVREKLGQDYADGLMCYTANLWGTVPSKYIESFDKFFRYKLAGGESVKDNGNTGKEIDEIFKRHGLGISPPW